MFNDFNEAEDETLISEVPEEEDGGCGYTAVQIDEALTEFADRLNDYLDHTEADVVDVVAILPIEVARELARRVR